VLPGRGRPGREFLDIRAVEPQRPFGGADDGGKCCAAPLVGDDAQLHPMPLRALLQHGQEFTGQRQRVEPATVRPPLPHLAEQPVLVFGGSRLVCPAHPRNQHRPGRVGQDLSLRDVPEPPYRQPGGEQGSTTADQHLAAVRVCYGQLPTGIGVHVDPMPVHTETPGLGVVH
jgi:hypothetical protein